MFSVLLPALDMTDSETMPTLPTLLPFPQSLHWDVELSRVLVCAALSEVNFPIRDWGGNAFLSRWRT